MWFVLKEESAVVWLHAIVELQQCVCKSIVQTRRVAGEQEV